MERKPLRYEEAHRLLKYHTHGLQKPTSHYLDPLPLPPEDLEPVPEKTVSLDVHIYLPEVHNILVLFHTSTTI